MKFPRNYLALLALAAVCVWAQPPIDPTSTGSDGQTCDNIRRELSALFQQVYEKKLPLPILKRFIPNLIELSMPDNCLKQWNAPASDQVPVSPVDPAQAEPTTADARPAQVKRNLVGGQDSWSLYAVAPGQARQVRDLVQLMNYLRKINGLSVVPEYSTVAQQGDVVSFGQDGTAAVADMKPRLKRVQFADAAEVPYIPSPFSIMLGTTQDPNTAKRVEFAGDMRNMIANSFMSFLPPNFQLAVGKESPELVRTLAPVWYFSNLQRSMSPTLSADLKTTGQKRTQDGYFGDPLSAKIRKRRESSEEKYDYKALWVGDYAIPLDVFKPRDKKEEKQGIFLDSEHIG